MFLLRSRYAVVSPDSPPPMLMASCVGTSSDDIFGLFLPLFVGVARCDLVRVHSGLTIRRTRWLGMNGHDGDSASTVIPQRS